MTISLAWVGWILFSLLMCFGIFLSAQNIARYWNEQRWGMVTWSVFTLLVQVSVLVQWSFYPQQIGVS